MKNFGYRSRESFSIGNVAKQRIVWEKATNMIFPIFEIRNAISPADIQEITIEYNTCYTQTRVNTHEYRLNAWKLWQYAQCALRLPFFFVHFIFFPFWCNLPQRILQPVAQFDSGFQIRRSIATDAYVCVFFHSIFIFLFGITIFIVVVVVVVAATFRMAHGRNGRMNALKDSYSSNSTRNNRSHDINKYRVCAWMDVCNVLPVVA